MKCQFRSWQERVIETKGDKTGPVTSRVSVSEQDCHLSGCARDPSSNVGDDSMSVGRGSVWKTD